MSKKRKFCEKCGVNPQEPTIRKNITYYRKFCASCNNKIYRKKHCKEYTRKKSCECCGTKPIIPELLHVDHIDGNSKNNNLKNYWTLCVTCHQIKTVIEYKNKQILKLSNKLYELERKYEKDKSI